MPWNEQPNTREEGPISRAAKSKFDRSVTDYSDDELKQREDVTKLTDLADILSTAMPGKMGAAAGVTALHKLMNEGKSIFTNAAVAGNVMRQNPELARDLLRQDALSVPDLRRLLQERLLNASPSVLDTGGQKTFSGMGVSAEQLNELKQLTNNGKHVPYR